MLKIRRQLRKTRGGKVQQILREVYLRDDISCGLYNCMICGGFDDHKQMIANTGKNQVSRILLLDASIALHQMDFLEHPSAFTAFPNHKLMVVVLRTVLDQVRQQSLSLYNRLRSLIASSAADEKSDKEGADDNDDHATDKRIFYVFTNEFHKDTFIERCAGESTADRQRRAILRALKWYGEHVPVERVPVSLLCADKQTAVEVCNQFGQHAALSLTDYVDQLEGPAAIELADMVASASSADGDDAEGSKGPVYAEEHKTQQQLQAGLKAGIYFQGKLVISNHNLFEGSIFASIDGEERSVKLIGRQALNRAVHDDIVVVELLPREQWPNAQGGVTIDEGEERQTDASAASEMDIDGDSEPALPPSADQLKSASPAGKVVGVVRRNWRQYCGSIDSASVRQQQTAGFQSVWFYPFDRHIPKIRLRTRQAQRLCGQRLIVSIDGWDRQSMFPRGHFVRALGGAGDKATELEVLLLEHDVPFQPFTRDVLACLPAEGEQWVVRDEQHLRPGNGREDFRQLNVCSIDPPGCTDIDDALHCRLLPNGNWEVGVHIADVTHFVRPNTPMDQEAARRGTTVYLVDKRIDMLPSLLGTNLCSLRSNVDRLAFSCMWEVTPQAEIVDTRFTKSLIRSKASLTYVEAQARIDDKTKRDELTESIRQLNRLAKLLRQQRIEAGSLTLSSPEVRFQLEHDSQDPVDVELKELKETNALVEEFMLLANISVAKQIHKSFPESAVLRRHPSPPQTNFDDLKRALARFNLDLSVDSSKQLADSLDKALIPADDYFNRLVRILTTRCMMQAVYYCSGTMPEHEFWHYGLAAPIYTHFTSPIRRYADVMVHRLLAASISIMNAASNSAAEGGETTDLLQQQPLLDRVKVVELCDNLNYRHRMAQHASRSSVELYTNLFFRGKVCQEDGYVTRVMKNGVSVLVPKYGLESFAHLPALSDKENDTGYEFDPEKPCLCPTVTGSELGRKELRVFSKVRVEITIDESSIAGLRQRLRMTLLFS